MDVIVWVPKWVWYLHIIMGVVFAYIMEKHAHPGQHETSFPERYIILRFICRRFVSFIIILGNGKLLNSVSDTFVNVVFKRLLSHHIKKGREENSVTVLFTLKISKTFDRQKA